ncbi:tRNA1(Val) (adenine(37)-N6)-methyltransferase [Veronia pacifica]|uniref:tRNA1(Val) (adenine(37)-N6)-methyltransferase n=1 Tax=Veronia pacifica TaxID=1080227 RepID=A0A1C3EGX9_9GAMM|nr:methyltransferase [Veronia pacifica]ODA32478.1 SAM-dependent methyltransferase [Veronia pacifica]
MGKRFQFKQFVVDDFSCGMPVSTDGVMLGAWAGNKKGQNILDIGCGTGLLSLMMAQRFPSHRLTAVDIEPQAVKAASENAVNSPWAERITILHQDIREWEPAERFDCIVCNPPYFNSGETSANDRRAKARHSHNLPHNELLERVSALLSEHGEAHFILPAAEAETFVDSAPSYGLFTSRKLLVKATVQKPVSRWLFTLDKHPDSSYSEHTMVIHDQGKYSEEFIALTRNFYLKM